MDTQLWDLFRETGDPLGYLLYRAEDKKRPDRREPKKKTEKDGTGASLSL